MSTWRSTDFTQTTVTGSSANFTTTSTTYVPMGVFLTGTVPNSTVVELEFTADLWSSSATNHSYMSFQIISPAGTASANPTDIESCRVYGTNGVRVTCVTATQVPNRGAYGTNTPNGTPFTIQLFLRSDSTSATANAWQSRLTVRGA